MFKKPAVKRGKDIHTLINSKSHVQKKYFSLMLVPSYSSGRTRSVRIPYGVFYGIIISTLVLTAVITGFYLRSKHFMRIAQDINDSLDQANEAYLELQANSETELSRLLDDSEQLKTQLTEEQIRSQADRYRQRQDYQQSLDAILEQISELEQRLRELDRTRQEVIDNLGAKAYIPPVATMLTEMGDMQDSLFSALGSVYIRSDERSSSVGVTLMDLEDYFTLLSVKIDTQSVCYDELDTVATRIGPYVKNYPTRWPAYGQISSGFGYRMDAMGGSGSENHTGIDIFVPYNTNVRATGGGIVIEAGYHGAYGNMVVIDHGIGLQTAYAHNSTILVSVGQRVERGDVVALSGSTGRSTGPHVHYEVRVNGTAVNPTKYFLE